MNRQVHLTTVIKPSLRLLGFVVLVLVLNSLWSSAHAASITSGKQTIQALYIPLADHYAAVVAYEEYRLYFQSGEADIKQAVNDIDIFADTRFDNKAN